MIGYSFLDKERTDAMLPALFAILHANMSAIAPTGNSYEKDYEIWRGCVGPALQKERRQIVLIRDGDALIGYLQYYTNESVFMIEEAQLKEPYQNRGIMRGAFTFLAKYIPREIPFVEAFAHKENLRSRAILRRLGFKQTEEKENGTTRFRRDSPTFLARFTQTAEDGAN